MDFAQVKLTRSNSTGNISKGEHHGNTEHGKRANSESSLDNIFVEIDNKSNTSSNEFFDSGFGKTEEPLSILEKKLDRLSDILQEQQNLLKILKVEISMCNLIKKIKATEESYSFLRSQESDCSSQNSNERGKSLLDAIELSQAQCIDMQIKDAIAKFLQSEDLKDRVANTTADCVKSVITNSFTKTFPSTYMPILDNFHKRLQRYVTNILNNAFRELEGNTAYFNKSVHKTSRSIQFALEKHTYLLQTTQTNNNMNKTLQETLEDILKSELAEWRQKLVNVLTSQVLPKPEFPERAETPPVPPSPSQPVDSEKSIIEHLVEDSFAQDAVLVGITTVAISKHYCLKSAAINKLIKDGKVNQSFEEALSSSDLSLVMAACRAADPAEVFAAPCSLHQSTLLSLAQQLATDMVHDTQLKCRYLEEAIINLNAADPGTRSYLPLVVGEIRKHLSNFLQTFPSHVAGRRISLILLAADNLLK